MREILKRTAQNAAQWCKDNDYLCFLWVLCIIALIIFTGHYSNILLDIGREVYYPERILEGKVLYRDLFNIYGPFAYQWNAILYAVLGKNLSTLYFSGAVSSLAIVSGVYLIANKFFGRGLSFTFGCLAIATGVCATHLFNFTFPYSQAMLYGTVSFLYSLLFILKFNETKKSEYLYISTILAGLCAVNKYDFLLYAAVLFIGVCFTRNIKYILNSVTCFMIFPIVCFGTLFIQGLRIEHILETSQILNAMANCDTLKYFYSMQGIFFNKQMLTLWPVSAAKTILLIAGLMAGIKLFDKNNVFGWVVTSLFAILTVIFTTPANYVFILPAILIASIFSFKKFKENSSLLILILAALSVSAKTFLSITPMTYGNYNFAIILIAFFALLLSYFDKKYQKAVTIFIAATAICFTGMFTYNRIYLNTKISTSKGTIYTNSTEGNAALDLLGYLKFSKAKDVVIYPEGLLLNFLSDTKSEDWYNSLIPLYEEVFGDDRIIDYFAQKRPEYIVLSNLSMKDYYYETICVNYAIPFCKFIAANYDIAEGFDYGRRYLIYKRK